MVDRIRMLLQARQLSPTQFADAIGLARPIVSHIMSGRNKPSLEVVQKVLAAFPDLSMAWLLNGSGPMLATVDKPKEAETAPILASPAPRRRPAAPAPTAPALSVHETFIEPGPAPEAEVPAGAPATRFLPGPAAMASVTTTAPTPAGVSTATGIPPELALFAEPGKAIRRIVIFYRDGTFADYQPE